MNKVVLVGRLTRDPETRYSQAAEPIAVVRFAVAVNRKFKREGEPDADFINCVVFGKTGETISRYFKKGNMIAVSGRIQTGSYEKEGRKIYTTDVVVEDFSFVESKASAEASRSSYVPPAGAAEAASAAAPAEVSGAPSDTFYKVEESVDDDDLPF